MESNELNLTLDLLLTRKQLIEARAQVMQYQHAELEAEVERVRKQIAERISLAPCVTP